MPSIDINTFLKRGQLYTITFKSSGWYKPLLDTITSELQYIPGIGNATATYSGGLLGTGFFSDQLDVTFLYTGDGSDVIANIVQNMLDQISGTFAQFDYVGAYTGATGTPTEVDKVTDPIKSLTNPTSLWAIAIILIVVVFVASGGIGITKQFTSK